MCSVDWRGYFFSPFTAFIFSEHAIHLLLSETRDDVGEEKVLELQMKDSVGSATYKLCVTLSKFFSLTFIFPIFKMGTEVST